MYKAFQNFIFRSPLLPFQSVKDALGGEDELFRILSDDKIQEAIFLGSPVLYTEIRKLLANNIKDDSERERIINSAVRYISRMSTRCTPFGLFAVCGLGTFEKKTQISLKDAGSRKTRLDMQYLYNLYVFITKETELKNKIKYYPNSSIYEVGSNIRYIETLYTGANRRYQISEVEGSTYLREILIKARNGYTIKNLVNFLCELCRHNISIEDGYNYINELIDSQLLIGELCQSITGDDFLERLINLIEKCGEEGFLLYSLKQIRDLLIELDTSPSNHYKIYNDIISIIKSIDVPFEEKYLFQVDSFLLSHQATLNEQIIIDLHNCLLFLSAISRDNNETLNQFKHDFFERYEEREIPLLEVLDPDIGLGYPSKSGGSNVSPIIDDLYIPNASGEKSSALTAFQSFMLGKIVDAKGDKRKEIIFTEKDIDQSLKEEISLPSTIYTLIQIIKYDDNDQLIALNSFNGSSGANLLGRFAHLHPDLERSVREIVNKEKELFPEKILAEIVHLPESRIGNILARPHIRDYELLYMSTSDLNSDKLIYLSDVTLSLKHNKLTLNFKKNKKEIIPRLTTAHNFHNPQLMPVYRFLCDIQAQEGGGVFFSWGKLDEMFSFLPRVRFNNIILSPAQWNIKTDDIRTIFSRKSEKEILSSIDVWRKGIDLPQEALLADGDNELYVDFGNIYSVKAFYSIIKRRNRFRLKEFLFDKQNALVKSEEQPYLSECIISFYKQ